MKLEKLCKTCNHWQPEFNVNKAGEIVNTGEGFCRLTESNLGVARFPESLAIASDDSEYWAQLMVKENFGCVQWEIKMI